MTVAQNALIWAMVTPMLHDIFLLEDVLFSRQCGIDRLRFLAPVPVNSSILVDATLKCARTEASALKFTLECSIECDRADRPVLKADVSYRAWPISFSEMLREVLPTGG